MEKKKFKFSLPSSLVLLIALTLIAGLMTYIIPAGSFDRVFDEATGRNIVQAGTYHQIENTPVGLFDMFTAVPQGFIESANIMALALIVGGAFGIINATGGINAMMGAFLKKMDPKKSYLVAFAIMALMAVLGIALGAAELLLPFIPLVVSIAFAMGYDSMTAVGIVLLGGGAGFAGSCMNPAALGAAQTVAGLPLYSGMGLRNVGFVFLFTAAVIHVFRYMKKVRANPLSSCMYEIDKTSSYEFKEDAIPEFNSMRKLNVTIFAVGLVIMLFCSMKFSWSINQITAYYLVLGIVCGFAAGFGPEEISRHFTAGAKEMLYSAMVIGTARAISVVMTNGNILDTITYWAGNLVAGMPASVQAIGMFIVQDLLSIVIPSGSGQAVATMPIMIPLADLLGMTRQTAVLAFQYGDALTNLVTPTSGYFMAALAMCNIKWDNWMKFFLPLFCVWVVICSIMLVVATMIGYGPF